jgi:hypothetical protein
MLIKHAVLGIRLLANMVAGHLVLLAIMGLAVAAAGLAYLQVDGDEIAHWLGIIEQRVESRQTGAAWQRGWVARHGRDFSALMQAYLQQQESGLAVHEWSL